MWVFIIIVVSKQNNFGVLYYDIPSLVRCRSYSQPYYTIIERKHYHDIPSLVRCRPNSLLYYTIIEEKTLYSTLTTHLVVHKATYTYHTNHLRITIIISEIAWKKTKTGCPISPILLMAMPTSVHVMMSPAKDVKHYVFQESKSNYTILQLDDRHT